MTVFGLGDLAFMGVVGAPVGPYVMTDVDAAAYVGRVEGASGDNQALEDGVRQAIDDFVIGCKSDGIWNAIKASCILAGARTLNGALQPLVGTAPTNPGSVFVSGDYNRKTGLKGNGSSKYLDSNRANNADPLNDMHIACWASEAATGSANGQVYMGSGIIENGTTHFGRSDTQLYGRCRNGNAEAYGGGADTGLLGMSRSSSASYIFRRSGNNQTFTRSSTAVSGHRFLIYNASRFSAADPQAPNYSDARIAFYSIGESLDLALLDARVTALINAYAAIL